MYEHALQPLILTSLTATTAPSFHGDPRRAFKARFTLCRACQVDFPGEMLSLFFSAVFEAVAFPFLSHTVKIQLQPLTVNYRKTAPMLFEPAYLANGYYKENEQIGLTYYPN